MPTLALARLVDDEPLTLKRALAREPEDEAHHRAYARWLRAQGGRAHEAQADAIEDYWDASHATGPARQNLVEENMARLDASSYAQECLRVLAAPTVDKGFFSGSIDALRFVNPDSDFNHVLSKYHSPFAMLRLTELTPVNLPGVLAHANANGLCRLTLMLDSALEVQPMLDAMQAMVDEHKAHLYQVSLYFKPEEECILKVQKLFLPGTRCLRLGQGEDFAPAELSARAVAEDCFTGMPKLEELDLSDYSLPAPSLATLARSEGMRGITALSLGSIAPGGRESGLGLLLGSTMQGENVVLDAAHRLRNLESLSIGADNANAPALRQEIQAYLGSDQARLNTPRLREVKLARAGQQPEVYRIEPLPQLCRIDDVSETRPRFGLET